MKNNALEEAIAESLSLPSRTVVFVVKYIWMTEMAQSLDVFEKFKFFGRCVATTQEQKPSREYAYSAQEMLRVAAESKNQQFAVVGVIVVDGEAVFEKGHMVYSDGEKWATIQDLCELYNSKLVEDD